MQTNSLRNKAYFLVAMLFSTISVFAQQQRVQYKANDIEYDKRIAPDANRLIGNVVFTDQGTRMYCDSAYFYDKSQDIDAFGNIRIIPDNGNTSLTGKILHYKSSDRVANIVGNVVLINDSATLTTQSLFYNLNTGVSNYPTKGTILSGQNKIVSDQGVYNKNIKQSYFKKNVVVTNPQYVIHTDTMNYNTKSKIVEFQGPTVIVSNENDSIYCEKGWYNTNNDISSFRQNAWLKYNGRIIRGDTLYYEKQTGLGKAYGNIETVDTSNNIIVRGNFAIYDRAKQSALVTKNALMIQVDKTDSLYLHADTIFSGVFTVTRALNSDSTQSKDNNSKNKKDKNSSVSQENADNKTLAKADSDKVKPAKKQRMSRREKKRLLALQAGDTIHRINPVKAESLLVKSDTAKNILKNNRTEDSLSLSRNEISDTIQATRTDTFKYVVAYHHVKFFRADLQGKCDSLYYSFQDSSLQFMGKPVLWAEGTQLKAEHVKIFTRNQKMDRMQMTSMSFIVNQDDSVRFNQIKGRNMTGYFTNNELTKMNVIGNGQTVYFARDKGIIMGVQKCESSDITLFFKKPPTGKMVLDKITYKKTVNGVFHPPLELKGNDLVLKDFEWLEDDRPKVWRDVFIWEENK
jgi:lipopolysaccharide export system protein LptA